MSISETSKFEKLQKKISLAFSNESFKEILGKSFGSLIVRVLGIGISLVFNIILARQFGADGLGNFSLLVSIVIPLSVLARLGFEILLIKKIALFNIDSQSALKRSLLRKSRLAVAITSILIGLFWCIYRYIVFGSLDNQNLILIIALPLHALLILNVGALKGEKKTVLAAVFENLIIWGSAFFVFVVLVWFRNPLEIFASISYLIGILIAFLTSFISISNVSKKPLNNPKENSLNTQEKSLSQVNKIVFSDMVKESFPIWVTTGISILLLSTDIWFVAFFLDSATVGHYSASAKLAILISFPLGAVINIASPKFSEAYSNAETHKLKQIYHQSTRLAGWLSIPIFLTIVIFHNQILDLFGGSFSNAILSVLILSIGQLLNVLFGPNNQFLIMTGRAKIVQFIMVLTLISSVSLSLILIPFWGINGAALASMITITIKNIILWIVIYRFYGFSSIPFPAQKIFSNSANTNN